MDDEPTLVNVLGLGFETHALTVDTFTDPVAALSKFANDMRQKGMAVISVAVLIYLGFCLFLYASQRRLMYFPTPEVQVPDAADVRIENDGETLKIWRLVNADVGKAIIYFGGNAEDVAANIPQFKSMFPGHVVYLVNYRGYGGSTGSPSETGLYRDALAVYDEIHLQHQDISVIGRSLGSGVASYLASVRDIDRLVLVTPFDSIENVARKSFPFFPVSLLIKDRFNALGYVDEIDAPVLVVIAEHDEVIPRRHSETLAAAFPEAQISIEIIHDAGHNTIATFPRYGNVVSMFLATELREVSGVLP